MNRILSTLVIATLFMTALPSQSIAKTSPNQYVRTANYFLLSGPALDENLEALSTFDLLIIPVEAQVYNKSFFASIRKLNQNIVILPYIATVSWNDLYWDDPLHQKLYAGFQADWWLTDHKQNQLSVWPGTRALNLHSDWVPYLAHFVQNEVLSTGLWDGIFYDEVQDSISWVGQTDVDNNGQPDSAQEANTLWAENYKRLFDLTRSLIGDDTILITNGSSNPVFSPFINGRMFETFPSSKNSVSEWKNRTSQYLAMEKNVASDPINIINVNSENSGVENDYQRVRFGLTTTLLGDGYFSYDHGTENHAQLWTYDEYDAYLGLPKTSLTNTVNPQQTSINIGVWQREFEEGKVVVNATQQSVTVDLAGEFEKLHGIQDVKINNGAIVSEVTIASQDGIILLRPIEAINDATFLNGAFARIFSNDGKQKRTGFFAYENSVRGGTQVVRMDLNHDGLRETIVADNTFVSVYESDGTLRVQFAPYTASYKKGVNISVGDLDNDGSVEIVTGTENGGGPQVRIFNQDGRLINPGFFAYDKNFRGGVNVAIGDLNGDGKKEIICGAGVTGGPHVRVFNKNGKLINPGFFAYDKNFRGGVNISVADVDGDSLDDIVTGPGVGGSPLARIFNKDGKQKSEFYVFDKAERHGLEIVANDVDGDGRAEIIGLTTDVFTLSGESSK